MVKKKEENCEHCDEERIEEVVKTIPKFKAKGSCSLQHNDMRLHVVEGNVYEGVDPFWLPFLQSGKII